MAREKLNQDEKRTIRFSVYVNNQEAELVKKYAEDAGTNPTDYLRRAGLNQMKKVVPGVNREKWRELGNLVGLLNQIAKGVNTGQVQNVKTSLLEEIKNEVQKLRIELISDNKHNNLVDFLRNSPLVGAKLDLSRNKDYPRETNFEDETEFKNQNPTT